jgi:hypothetical protein
MFPNSDPGCFSRTRDVYPGSRIRLSLSQTKNEKKKLGISISDPGSVQNIIQTKEIKLSGVMNNTM